MNTQEAILTRKSVRGFTKEQLTEGEVKSILDAAYASPIAGGALNGKHFIKREEDMCL